VKWRCSHGLITGRLVQRLELPAGYRIVIARASCVSPFTYSCRLLSMWDKHHHHHQRHVSPRYALSFYFVSLHLFFLPCFMLCMWILSTYHRKSSVLAWKGGRRPEFLVKSCSATYSVLQVVPTKKPPEMYFSMRWLERMCSHGNALWSSCRTIIMMVCEFADFTTAV
jgi:hypothetical protein